MKSAWRSLLEAAVTFGGKEKGGKRRSGYLRERLYPVASKVRTRGTRRAWRTWRTTDTMGSGASEVLFMAVNHSITLMGKVWLVVMVFLRLLVLLLAGFPLYQDEQERFVCNTIQPGCANVCYDLFSPVSLFRFWLLQLFALCLPYAVFVVYVVHAASNSLNPAGPGRASPAVPEQRWASRSFTGAYILHLLLRTLLEAGFGAAQHHLFGFHVPRRFLCRHAPCTTQVDCYISRPTEKTVMLNVMLGLAALGLLLDVLDFICAIKRSVEQKRRRREATAGKALSEEQSFGKRHSSKSSSGGEAPDFGPGPPVMEGPANRKNGCWISPEEPLERTGSDVALCPQETGGTPKSIRVNKRCRLKPPPPPRRDLGLPPGRAAVPAGGVSTATALCAGRVGQHTLVELGNEGEDGQGNRSEWV